MSSFTDEEYIQRLFVAKDDVRPELLGRGPGVIRGSAYLQGPVQIGNDRIWPNIAATLMVGPLKNSDSPTPAVPGASCGTNWSPYSLAVFGGAVVYQNLQVSQDIIAGKNIVAQGDIKSKCGVHSLSRKKNFDIPHPSKPGWRLRHTCPEGPTNDVYVRGRIKNQTEINLPSYWKDFVNEDSITVNLTPIGAHQDVIIKRWDNQKIYLQSKGGMPIDCFYTVFAERKDGEKLISEYKGESPADYPGNNDEYSVSGYHYDVKDMENKE